MMKPLPCVDGFYVVLPNRKSGDYGCPDLIWALPALSPMVLGPVEHQQHLLPPAKNLENFHQFNKVFASEVDITGEPLPIWYERRLQGYNDPVPHRHKLGATKKEHLQNSGGKCLYSIYNDRRYSYIESREFYCSFYETLATDTEEFQRLIKRVHGDGASICIVGYDSPDINPTEDEINRLYLDPSAPFGHEMVICAMIMFWPNTERFPWRRFSKKNT